MKRGRKRRKKQEWKRAIAHEEAEVKRGVGGSGAERNRYRLGQTKLQREDVKRRRPRCSRKVGCYHYVQQCVERHVGRLCSKKLRACGRDIELEKAAEVGGGRRRGEEGEMK